VKILPFGLSFGLTRHGNRTQGLPTTRQTL